MKKTKIIVYSIIIALILNMIMPLMTVMANSNYTISFSATGTHTLENDNGHLKIDGQYVDLRDSNNQTIGEVNVNGNSASITVNNGTAGQLNYNSNNNLFTLYNTNGHTAYVMGTEINSNAVFMVEDFASSQPQNNNQGGSGEQGENQNRKTSGITVTAGNGTYGNNRAYDADVEVCINNERWNHTNTISYEANNEDTTVNFKFETLWINKFYENIVINGVSYNVSDYLDFNDRTQWLNANHGSQTLSFEIPNVAKADNYNVVVKNGENLGQRYLATFLWTADPAQAKGHNYIGNAKLEFVKAVYSVGNTKYTVTEKDLEGKLHRDGAYLNADSDDGFLRYGVTADVDYDDGSLTLPGNAEITMRVVPKYGYQVTSVNGGNNFKTTDEGVSEFTVTVADGTAGYFQATVEKVNNLVTPTSEKVKSGEIKLGDNAATDIKNGTVRLSVEDVVLSSDKISNFQEKANEAGEYTISNYLDINLDKVLYKGTSEDVWSEQIHHLTDKALITLQLDEGVDASNIVIVHNIDNGDEFEIIKIESYDPETNTITFYTDSFSNYAIASKVSKDAKESASEETNTMKEVSTDKEADTATSNNPTTGDNIIVLISTFVIAGIGAYITTKINKGHKTRKH